MNEQKLESKISLQFLSAKVVIKGVFSFVLCPHIF